MGYVTEEKATEAVTIFCNGHLNGNGNTHTGNNSDGTKHDNCHHGKFGSTKKESTEDCGCYTAKVTTTSTYIYNDNWEVLSCTQKRDGASTIKYCYTYDKAGNRTQSEEWCGNTRTDVVNYTYNSANQIETSTTLDKNKWVTTTYEYDADGNLIETIAGKDQIKNITTYEYDTENRLKAVTGGKDLLLAVTYDGDGNRAFQLDFCPPAKAVGARDTKIPEGLSDAAMELYDGITNNGGNASPNYCLTEYLNNVNTTYAQTLVEYGINFDSEVTYTYGNERISIKTEGRKRDVYGNKLNKETSKCYYIYDGRGSVERVLNEEHETDKFAYDPFGNLTLGYSDNVNSNSLVHRTGNMYTYNAEDYNRETGFQYLRARWYDTNTARFISEDSYLGTKAEPLTRNRYIYTCNNPMNYVDPSGHRQTDEYTGFPTAGVSKTISDALAESRENKKIPMPLSIRDLLDKSNSNSTGTYLYSQMLEAENMQSMQNCENKEGEEKFKYEWKKVGLPSTEYVTTDFMEKVIEISELLQADPDDMMAVMAFESWLNPACKNQKSGATGLIQFMESTAEQLGTTTDDLEKMTGVQQLEFVFNYYEPYKGKLNNIEDVYMVTLWPVAVGKSSDYHLFEMGSLNYKQNKGLDLNQDGVITKEEATNKVLERRKNYE